MKEHNFNRSMRIENKYQDDINNFYKKIFGSDMKRLISFSDFNHPGHKKMQQNGIDKKVTHTRGWAAGFGAAASILVTLLIKLFVN